MNVALLVGGRLGEKLCRTFNVSVSSSTLIRIIHQQSISISLFVDAIGIDNWAFRKGVNYGSAIVDLNLHKVADLLPD